VKRLLTNENEIGEWKGREEKHLRQRECRMLRRVVSQQCRVAAALTVRCSMSWSWKESQNQSRDGWSVPSLTQ
jgi:hypothetical protein